MQECLPMIYRRWMLFVDGENFTIEGEKIAKQHSIELFGKPLRAPVEGSCPYYVPGVYLWLPPTNQASDAAGTRRFWPDRTKSAPALLDGQRSFYYTAIQGSEPSITETQERLWSLSFEPVVFKKPKGRKAKGVDIAITKDMLVHAFDDNYDLAVLMSGRPGFHPNHPRGQAARKARIAHRFRALPQR